MPGLRAQTSGAQRAFREIRLERALKGTDVPHAELVAADESGEVLGAVLPDEGEIDG